MLIFASNLDAKELIAVIYQTATEPLELQSGFRGL